MKLSQLKKILKESAKEAVIEVLNEISAQQHYAPQKINESFVSPQLANNLRNMFAPPAQTYSPPPTQHYTQPNPYVQQPFIQKPPIVPPVLPKNALGSILGAVANKMDANDIAGLTQQDFSEYE